MIATRRDTDSSCSGVLRARQTWLGKRFRKPRRAVGPYTAGGLRSVKVVRWCQ